MTARPGDRFRRSQVPTIVCQRCEREGQLEWFDLTTLGDAEPNLLLYDATCLTPGCTWQWPPPPDPTPGDLRQRAERIWERMHLPTVDQHLWMTTEEIGGAPPWLLWTFVGGAAVVVLAVAAVVMFGSGR